jgi:hypothetical protein
MCSCLPGEDSDGSGDARVASAVRKIPPMLVGMPEKMVNNSYALAQFAINGNSGGAGEICFSNPEDTRSGTPTCYLKYNFERVFIKSWSTSGDADDRPTEEVAFYYNKIAFGQQTEAP